MDYETSCSIMGLEHPFNKEELKKRYYKLALKYHPDRKNEDMDEKEQTETFQKVFEAYSFLCNNHFVFENEDVQEDLNETYLSIFNKFLSSLSGIKIERKNVTDVIQDIIQFTSFKAFDRLDKENASKIFTYIERYNDILMIGENNINALREKMRDKTKYDISHNITVTLDDLLDSKIAEIEYNYSKFHVPLWHDEVTFPLPNITYDDSESNLEIHEESSDIKSITFKCILENVPDHIFVDEDNNIHVNINLSLNNTILEREYIEIKIGKSVFKLFICELHLRKIQTYTFYNCGISRINTNDIYNSDKKGNICVHISMKTLLV